MDDALARTKSQRRIRRTPSDLRAEAICAARRLIVDGADRPLTMRAVVDEVGVTYPNLSHHFGSAAGLHAAVAEELVRELLSAMRAIETETRDAENDFLAVVDRIFDLFQRDGLAHIIGWLAKSPDSDRLRPLGVAVQEFLYAKSRRAGHPDDRRYAEMAMMLTFAAFAEAAVGSVLGQLVSLSQQERRRTLANMMAHLRAGALLTSP